MIAPARRAALSALQAVTTGHAVLGSAIAEAREGLRDPRDAALLFEMVAGTLRMRGAIDFQLALRVKRPLARVDPVLLDLLRLSAFQLLYLARIPMAAVIHDAVNIARASGMTSAAGFVNAVLRSLGRDRDALAWPPRPAVIESEADQARLVEHLSVVHSHPPWLVSRWLIRHGEAATAAWLAFNNRAPALCLAVNRALVSRDALADALSSEGVRTTPTSTAPGGLIVDEGSALTTQAFRDGWFVVQDEASQLVVAAARARAGGRTLDLCASPGGKTVALAAAVGPEGLVVACDVRPRRLRLLRQTLSRCHVTRAPIVQVPRSGPLPFRMDSFDTVFIDAPCSGLGTLRRDPDLKWAREAVDLPVMAAEQRALLERAAPLVRPGGSLIYSTCSSEPEENQTVATAFGDAHPEFTTEREHQTLPFRDGLEAFFAIVWRRTAPERLSNAH